MKKLFVLVLALVTMFALVGCAGSNEKQGQENKGAQDDAKFTVGIVQIVEHPSLNTIREACVEQLAAKGFVEGDNVVIDYQNAQNDQTNLKTICQKFADNNYDLIIAIATPSAQAAAGETQTIPIIFAACTDPLGSGLVTDLNHPGGNITGTSDAVSAEKIMELAKRITPDIKTVGALYSSSETNSIAVIENLKEYAAKNGMTVIDATVTNSSEVQQAASVLTGKADCIFSPIDNTVASAMPIVAQVANKAKTPVYVGADSMVKDGGLATYGINYVILGQETADMAAEVLKGKNPGDIPVRTMSEMDIYLNQTTADTIGITIPEDVRVEAKEIF